MIKKFLITLALFCATMLPNPCQASSGIPTNMIDGLIQNYIIIKNDELPLQQVQALSHAIIYYSYQYGIDPLLVTAMISCESCFSQDSTSSAGAIGLTQLMPATAEAVGVNPYDANQNIEGGCSYLATQIKNFSQTATPVELALAAYNAGPNAVWKHGGIPPYAETQNYVENIRAEYFRLYDSLMYALA